MFKKLIITIGIIITGLLAYSFNEYRLFSKTYSGVYINNTAKSNSALLIIDIQNDLTQPDGKVHVNQKQVDQIISNINKISDILNDNNIEIIYIRHEYRSPFFKIILNDALSEKSDGAKFDERLNILNNNIFIKNYMDPFSNSHFQTYLNSKNIGCLLICGIDAKFCINKSVLSAIQKGYDVSIISDGIAGSCDDIRNQKIMDFKKLGVKIMETENFIKRYE